MRIDVHCHIGQRCRPCQPNNRFSFEPAQQYAPYDAYFSDCLNRSIAMRLARWHFGLSRLPETTGEHDAAMERILLTHIVETTWVDRVVVLAFDQYHTTDGEPIGPRARRSQIGTDLYVSNTYARSLWIRHPKRVLFGASIHPYRRLGDSTAVDMLDEAAAAGAVLIKWLPLVQNIDAEDPRAVAFLRRAAEIGMPMLIHYGREGALGTMQPQYHDPSPLLRTLRRLRAEDCMPTVIVAHVATPMMGPIGSPRTFRIMIDALTGEFTDAPLYADISALTLPNKAHWLKRLARMPQIHHKLVYGSDFPIPPFPLSFCRQVGRRFFQLRRIPNWIDRDAAIKAALGFNHRVLARGGDLLRHRIARADALGSRV